MEYEIHELLDPFHAVTEDALAPIKASMAANGYNPNAPITLYEGKIIDGRHRYEAAVETGVVDQITVMDFVGDYAAARRHAAEANTRVGLSHSQRAAIAAEMVTSSWGGDRTQVDRSQVDGGQLAYSLSAAASDWQISERVISNMRGVLEYDRQHGTRIHAQTKAGEIASVAAAVRARDDANSAREAQAAREREEREAERRRLQEAEARAQRLEQENAAREAREREAVERREKARQEREAALSQPATLGSDGQKYAVIYADPPWTYESAMDNRKIENHYPTMDLDAIKALPVSELAADDCALYLWATPPLLHKAIAVMDAWGFEFRSSAVWDKRVLGMGYWFRQQHEVLLVGTKGSPPPPTPETRISSVISEKRTAHSVKPQAVYEMLESQYPDRAKIELFARNAREGWDKWGNQA